jgi:RNA polymerase sigma-70 factor (ECF subfamily)
MSTPRDVTAGASAASSETELTEPQLRELAERGELAEVARLVISRHGAELLRYLAAVTRDDGEAAEVFAQTCEDLWRGLPGFRWQASLRTWLYTLARHAWRRRGRDRFRRAGERVALSDQPELAAVVRTQTAQWQRTEVRDRLAALRAQLTEEDRELLALRVDRGLAWREIAQVLEDTDDAAALTRRSAALRKRFERIKELIRSHLAQPS